jgi:hypothetical protein
MAIFGDSLFPDFLCATRRKRKLHGGFTRQLFAIPKILLRSAGSKPVPFCKTITGMRYSRMRSWTNCERCYKTNVAEDIMMAMISPGDGQENQRQSFRIMPLKAHN